MISLTPIDPAVDVTVSLVNWNGAGWLRDCLESLRGVQGVRMEVIVVDNASSDASVEIVRENFREASLVVNPSNFGFARANNQALALGRGRYFFLLNNDTVLQPGSVESLVKFLDAHPKVGIAAGRLENRDGSVQFQYYPVTLPSLGSIAADLCWLNRIWPRAKLGRGGLARRWDPGKASRMEQLPGACMMIRREVLHEIGLLDESFDFWYEDVDFSHRAGKAGWELWYVPEARIFHLGGASSGLQGGATRSLWRFRNLIRYARRYFSSGKLFLLRAMLAAVLVLRLPLVVAAGAWPDQKVRRVWRGAWRAYLKLLGEVISLPDQPAGLPNR